MSECSLTFDEFSIFKNVSSEFRLAVGVVRASQLSCDNQKTSNISQCCPYLLPRPDEANVATIELYESQPGIMDKICPYQNTEIQSLRLR